MPQADWFAQQGIEQPQPFPSRSDAPENTQDPACQLTALSDDVAPEVWPCNALAVKVFCAMQTQWQVGMGGPVGLMYASLPRVEEALRVPLRRRGAVFFAVQVMERETLRVWGKQAADRQAAARRT